jgi:hypothetical protein
LTRKTHAFTKSTSTWDALFELALFEHNWLRAHRGLAASRAGCPDDTTSGAPWRWQLDWLSVAGPGKSF